MEALTPKVANFPKEKKHVKESANVDYVDFYMR